MKKPSRNQRSHSSLYDLLSLRSQGPHLQIKGSTQLGRVNGNVYKGLPATRFPQSDLILPFPYPCLYKKRPRALTVLWVMHQAFKNSLKFEFLSH